MPEVIFPGPEGRLEGRYHPQKDRDAPIAIILHPHPQFGGTMNNKLVYRTYQAFKNSNFSTLRFNFRGVGKSQGSYDNGVGELTDAAAALDWLQAENPSARTTWIAGFSFGAWLALQLLMRRPEISGFVAISPPASLYDFSFLAPCPTSGQVIYSENDELVSKESIMDLDNKIKSQKGVEVPFSKIKNSNHFFKNKEKELTAEIEKYIKEKTALI